MEAGRCPTCSAAYTAADVVGVGILRARPEAQGGPRVEYRCEACGRIIVLVPHGEGRYAPPGVAPPPAVPPEHRRPAWADGAGRRAGPPPRVATSPPPAHARAERTPPGPPPAPAAEDGDPVGPAEALELLGVKPTASREEVEQAFRARSLTCHPDKVAHLDAEFQALAHRKFRRLLDAFRLLTR